MQDKLERFAAMVQEQYKARMDRDYPPHGDYNHIEDSKTVVRMGKKFAKVDVGYSGKYMVDLATGEIFGIKAYGQVHKGHRYGTLDTLDEWYWGEYEAYPKNGRPKVLTIRLTR
jgi:hypothetical protein